MCKYQRENSQVIDKAFFYDMQGRIQRGAHPARAPPKIGKNMIFLAQNRDFSYEIPQQFF